MSLPIYPNRFTPPLDSLRTQSGVFEHRRLHAELDDLNRHTLANETAAREIFVQRYLPAVYRSIFRQDAEEVDADASARTFDLAIEVLGALAAIRFAPVRIVRSAEGGLAFIFGGEPRFADIEVLDTGEVLAATYSYETGESVVWEVEASQSAIIRTADRIRAYLSRSSA